MLAPARRGANCGTDCDSRNAAPASRTSCHWQCSSLSACWSRRFAGADATRCPATLRRHRQSRATDPHPHVAEAADEVMDSLEPYLVVARGDHERIPLAAFVNPFVMGFVLEYCKAAFAEISGTGEAGREGGLRVLEQLSKSSRLAALVGGWEQNRPPPGPLSEADQRRAVIGRWGCTCSPRWRFRASHRWSPSCVTGSGVLRRGRTQMRRRRSDAERSGDSPASRGTECKEGRAMDVVTLRRAIEEDHCGVDLSCRRNHASMRGAAPQLP